MPWGTSQSTLGFCGRSGREEGERWPTLVADMEASSCVDLGIDLNSLLLGMGLVDLEKSGGPNGLQIGAFRERHAPALCREE